MNNDDLMIVDDTSVMEDVVFSNDNDIRSYLRTEWLQSILSQMVETRLNAGLSQAALAESMGKSQPAIARLERGDDLKLSTLWDYYAGINKTPALQLSLESLMEAEEVFRKHFSRTPIPGKFIYRANHWLNVQKPPQSTEASGIKDNPSMAEQSEVGVDRAILSDVA